MSKTDEIIEKLAEYGEEPLSGHFERFEEKLSNRNRKVHFFSPVLKVAAVFVFAIFSASLLFYLKDQRVENRLSSVQSEELREAGIYYTNLINSELVDIEKMAKQGFGPENEVLRVKKELSEMDYQYQNIEKDYRSNPDDERVRSAIIEYYKAKLDILNTIKSDWENARQLKIRYNENLKS
jgi:hypothetical protein